MHLLSKIGLICGIICATCTQSKSQYLTIGSYNIRNENTYDTGNLWKDRSPYLTKLVQYHNFDIFGVQEALAHQLETLEKGLFNFAYYGIGRDDGKEAGEHSAIFFKKSKFTLMQKGDFWLSATPDVPSKSWDAPCCNRICTWVQLKDNKTGKSFFVFNAHYDYEKDLARNESSKLILAKIVAIAGNEPVILTGDMNGGNTTSWYKLLANSGKIVDTYKLAKYPYLMRGSFNEFGKSNDGELIDHVFCSKQFSVKRWALLTDTYGNGKFPSDHCPIAATLVLE